MNTGVPDPRDKVHAPHLISFLNVAIGSDC